MIVFNQYDQSSPGQTQALSGIWTDTECIVYYYEEASTLQSLGWMTMFGKRRAGDVVDGGLRSRVRKWRDDDTESDIFEYSILCEPKITNADAVQKITSVIA